MNRRGFLVSAGTAALTLADGALTMNEAHVTNSSRDDKPIALFLCGDVMTGRGIDQILPQPSDPGLYERYVTSATEYLELAEW